MNCIKETCGCGATWEGDSAYVSDRARFREVHAACRTPGIEPVSEDSGAGGEAVEQLTMIALTLKNQGVVDTENCTPEEGVERLISHLYASRTGREQLLAGEGRSEWSIACSARSALLPTSQPRPKAADEMTDWDASLTLTLRRGNAAAVTQALGHANNISAEAEKGKDEINAALSAASHEQKGEQ